MASNSRFFSTAVGAAGLLLAMAAGGPALFSAPLPAVRSGAADNLPDRVTWAEHVAALVYENCAGCHRPGDIAPMSLLRYEEARPWAKSMLREARDGRMPPWHADPAAGTFVNDRRLHDREVALLERWVKQGARAGDLGAAPAPPEYPEGWRLGEPNLILTLDPVELPAGGPDQFRDLVVDPGFEQDHWLRAIEFRAGDRRVVHHVILYATAGAGPSASGWLAAWAAGMTPTEFPSGTAKLIRAGEKVVADMHYHPTTEATRDQTQVGFYFFEGEPEKEMINLWIQNSSFKIPAGASDHVVKSSHTFRQDSTVYALLPHMHYRGKEFTYTATFPDGRQETLLHVPAYDFNWQTHYQLATPLKAPKGTRIDCMAHYDNSTGNKANPDPSRDVTVGNESFDEMMIGFVDFVVDDGRSPRSVEEEIGSRLQEWSTAHPGEVWRVVLRPPGEAGEVIELTTALYLPGGGDGSWLIPINGQPVEGLVADIAIDGGSGTATLRAPVGTFNIELTLSEGRLAGAVSQGAMRLTFEGEPVP